MPSQSKKFVEFIPPSGADALLLKSFSGTEQMSRLFQFDLELNSEDAAIKFEDVIGQKAVVRLDLADESKRWFHGIVSRFVQTHGDGRHATYRATMVPWLWLLTRASDCRIFQNLSVPDILQKVFEGHGFGGDDFELRLSGSYQPWEYCVQYRETDFNFVSRLMEQEGIYFFFEHQESQHKLIICDSQSAHTAFGSYDSIRYDPSSQDSESGEETVNDWTIEKEVQTGVYALKDFNFKKPSLPLTASSPITREHEKADFEIFDYPGEYEESAEADTYAKVRIQELQAQFEVLRGQASALGVATGAKFALTDHPRDDQNRPYLVTSTSIHISTGSFESGQTAEGDYFSCSFTAIPFDQPYRAPRLTPKPMIQGPQTAIVVGPSGEEIHTDEFGRVKLQFHWDRHGKRDENSSCWIRVSHANAGKAWGSMITPRIGHEVIVEFLEGDPDRPIITGRVYNGENRPPYAAGQGVVSGLKSNTHKGKGYNEMSMDDTCGKEKITIHAQYDMGTTVEHDDTQTVHNDRTISVDGKHTETIIKDTTIKITEGKLDHDVVAGTAKYHVQGAVSEDFDDKQETIVNKDIIITSESTKIHITAATEIKLEVGASKLLMKSDGSIELSGNNVAIKGSQTVKISGASITSQADADHNTKGALVLSEGSTSNTVKGGMVMLNP